ncbi:MAG: NnrU family protein, partial [Bradyrhizobiaceae bacterium]
MGLLVMILGLALFFATHVFTTRREARAQAIARLGEGTYKILYALVSFAGLALIIWGFAHYRSSGWIDV